MTTNREVFEALPNAFLLALLLTGSIEAAEAAVLDGIAALDSDYSLGVGLLPDTVKPATRRHPDSPEPSERALSIVIPLESRDHLLEPFVTAGKVNAFGLDLAVCRSAVVDHGGACGLRLRVETDSSWAFC